jgi:transaldolase
VLVEFAQAGVDVAALAERLLREGTQSFDTSWADLMECIASKTRVLGKNAPSRAAIR